MRKIELSFQKNIRDLGGLTGYKGLKVKYGKIYRGGFLGRVSSEDVSRINELHLTDIIDLRGHTEFVIRPDYPFEGVNFINLPTLKEDVQKEKSKSEDSNLLWFIDEGVSGFDHMYNLYPDLLLSKLAIESIKKFFRILIENRTHVFYFHCSQGKDRAGLLAYVLEIALGVSKEDAKADYLRSNEAMKVRIAYHIDELKNEPFYNEQYEKSLIDVFSAKEEYLDHAINEVEKKYGSMENYITKALCVDVEKLRALYLE